MSPAARGVIELDDFDAVFAALAHRARRTILAALQGHGGEMTSGAIAAWFEHSWPTTSAHLRVLQDAGLVSVRLHGRERIYHLEVHRLLTVTDSWLGHFR